MLMKKEVEKNVIKEDKLGKLTAIFQQRKNEEAAATDSSNRRQSIISSILSSKMDVSSRKSVIGESIANNLHDKLFNKKIMKNDSIDKV